MGVPSLHSLSRWTDSTLVTDEAQAWVCKLDPETGTCGEVDVSAYPLMVQSMAYRFAGCKQGRCRQHGFTKFVRRESADCGPLGQIESNIFAISAQSVRQIVFRNLVSRSLHRVVLGSDKHPGRTTVL